MTNRTDNFNRTDTTNDIGTPSDAGSAWSEVTVNAAWGIISNTGYESGGANQSICVLESSVANVQIQATQSTLGTDAGMIGREADDANYILCVTRTSGNTMQIYKKVTGTFTSLATFTGALASGDVLRLDCDSANLLAGYQNGTLRLSATDAAGSGNTKHGIRNGAKAKNNVRFDDFSITEIAAGAAAIGYWGRALRYIAVKNR